MKKILLFILLGILVCVIGGFSYSGIHILTVKDKLDNTDVTVLPSVDFVQPYMFAHEAGESFDYDKYFDDLAAIGYDSIIVQMTRTEEADLSSTFYYPTNITSDLVGTVNREYEYILEELLDACENHDPQIKVYMGLSVEEYSWWALTCYYDETYMNHCADTDVFMVNEIYEQFDDYDCFVGWYFGYELFSNPVGWEKLWAKNVNKVVHAVDALNDGRPILLSPFRQIILGNVTNEYLMWKSFFNNVDFRNIDIFCPQDSIGKLDSSDNSFKKIYDYLDAAGKAAKEAGLKYWVNCELFMTPDESLHLYVSDIERVSRQIKNAGRVTDTLVTFSASHYLLEQGTVDTDEARADFYADYKAFYDQEVARLN